MTNQEIYQRYRERVDHFRDIDSRELVFQNRVLIPFLEDLLREDRSLEVVDISTQYLSKNEKNGEEAQQDKSQYRSLEEGSSPPDLLIARNWRLFNRGDSNIQYLATIEVKSPEGKEAIYHKKPEEYLRGETGRQLRFHLEAKAPRLVVILTDCLRWQFFTRGGGGLSPRPDFPLWDNTAGEWRKDGTWEGLCAELRRIAGLPAV